LTGETLHYYSIGDLSGSYAFITQPLLIGLQDAAEYFNNNGGVCGATIEIVSRDTGGAQEQTQAFWDELSEEADAYMIYLYASADGELLLEQAVDKEIVLWNAAASELALYGESGEPSWQYTSTPLYVDQLGGFCDYVAANWESMGMEGDPMIGHLSWEGAFGRSSDTEGTRAYCESVGVGVVGAEYFLPGTPDISTQLQTLVDAGANIIYTASLATGPAQVASTAQTMGLGDSLMLGGVNWVLDTSVILLGGENVLGMTGALPYLWWDDIDNQGVQIVTGVWAEKQLATASEPVQAIQLRNVGYLTSFGLIICSQKPTSRPLTALAAGMP
jgi:ABC-type branched-subunit amino acid transport system substrate-binding protein